MKRDFSYKGLAFDDVMELENTLASNIINARKKVESARTFELKQYYLGYIEATKRAIEELENWYHKL